MAAGEYRVVFTQSVWGDLEEIVSYWEARGEIARGIQYARDLPTEALRRLSDRSIASSGRFLRHTGFPQAQELPVFKRAYRILYFVREQEAVVEVLRFWHSHRDKPFR
jgi:plasmid stabilization system protein ParE